MSFANKMAPDVYEGIVRGPQIWFFIQIKKIQNGGSNMAGEVYKN